MEMVTGLFPGMKVLKIRRIWSNADSSISRIGQITSDGIKRYWRGVDEVIQFWEQGQKRNVPESFNFNPNFVEGTHHDFRRKRKRQDD